MRFDEKLAESSVSLMESIFMNVLRLFEILWDDNCESDGEL